MNRVLFSSKSEEYSTPQYLFDSLNKEFCFNLDPFATASNHKCKAFYTMEDNGLEQNWGGKHVFCNSPYSNISKWVEKAYHEGQKDNTVVVLLIPSRTDTKWFHNFVYHKSEIRFIKGRLKFGSENNSAPFPSMVVIFRGAER